MILRSATSIGDNAFEGCSGLTSVTIPNDFDPKEIFPDYAGVVNAADDEDDGEDDEGEEAGAKSVAVKSATVHLPETDVSPYLVQLFMSQTGLLMKFAKDCLEKNKGNFVAALTDFQALQTAGKLKKEYFAYHLQPMLASQLAQIFVANTGVRYDVAQECLEKNGNNFERAFENIQALKRDGKASQDWFQTDASTTDVDSGGVGSGRGRVESPSKRPRTDPAASTGEAKDLRVTLEKEQAALAAERVAHKVT